MFNDQNAADMSGVLAVAERGYQTARFHYALMRNDPFARGWCCFEMMVRILAAMRALCLARPEDIVPLILRRDPRFTRLVIAEGLTDIHHDVTGRVYDRYGTMTTFDPADRTMIQRRIVEACGSPAAFNRFLSCYRSAAIQHFRQVQTLGMDEISLGRQRNREAARARPQGLHDSLWAAGDCGDLRAVRALIAGGADVEQRLIVSS
jgi:hypothetical protein